MTQHESNHPQHDDTQNQANRCIDESKRNLPLNFLKNIFIIYIFHLQAHI